MTFFIALFVLIMQFLWKYIDDIVGKGLELSVIFELLFYRSTALVPMALPIAVLISSVMVMGNLAERYELASMKSAGVPLLRIMASLIVVACFICVASFVSSDTLIPISNLKFKSRLYDIRRQKPALSLEEGVFNDDFGNTIIRIREKSADSRELTDVLIYDHSSSKGNDNQFMAKSGQMYSTEDKRFLIMKLFDGHQYQELAPSDTKKSQNFEHMRTSFKEWEKVYDLSEFNLNKTNEDLFKNHQSMLSIRQLTKVIDSLELRKKERKIQLNDHLKPFFHHRRQVDSLRAQLTFNVDSLPKTPKSFVSLLPEDKQKQSFNKAAALARNVKNYTRSVKSDMPKIDRQIALHEIEFHQKFSLAAACLIFLFIGAPMGAIVRKGGFGWPILIAIVFFVFFIMLNIVGKKIAEELVVSGAMGMWMSCLILFPIGVFLTIKAMNDSKVLNIDVYTDFIRKFFNRFLKIEEKEV